MLDKVPQLLNCGQSVTYSRSDLISRLHLQLGGFPDEINFVSLFPYIQMQRISHFIQQGDGEVCSAEHCPVHVDTPKVEGPEVACSMTEKSSTMPKNVSHANAVIYTGPVEPVDPLALCRSPYVDLCSTKAELSILWFDKSRGGRPPRQIISAACPDNGLGLKIVQCQCHI